MDPSRDARLMFIFAFTLFLQSYVTGNLLPTMLGMGVLAYLLMSKSMFSCALGNSDASLERDLEKRAYFADEPVGVNVRYIYPFKDEVFVEITDRLPDDSFVLEGSNTQKGLANPVGGIEYSYDVVRTKRGIATFEGLNVRISDKRGLFSTDKWYDLRKEVTYQDSRFNIMMAEYMARNSVREEVLKTSPDLAPGTDIAGIRDYQVGDKITHIDWKASSRLQKLVTKLSESKEHGSVYLILDASRTMRATFGDRSKFNHSILLVMQLAKIFLEHRNATGFVAFDEHSVLESVSPSLDAYQYDKMLESFDRLPDALKATYRSMPSYHGERLDDESKLFIKTLMPFLSGMGRGVKSFFGTSGFHRAVKGIVLDKEDNAMLLVISDLESRSRELIGTLKLARARGIGVFLITPYSPWYDMALSDLDVKTSEELYKSYLVKRENSRALEEMGVKVIEETPADTIDMLYPKISGDLR